MRSWRTLIPLLALSLEFTHVHSLGQVVRSVLPLPVVGGSSGVVPLETLVLDSFQKWRSVMVKGSITNGIPVMDPFLIPFDIPIRLSQGQLGEYELVLSQLTFGGLSTFKVDSLSVDPLSRDMTFSDSIQKLSVESAYRLNYILTSHLPLSAPISQGKTLIN
jgi:hypothetical protein